MKKSIYQSGFTLLEILISIVILTSLIIIISSFWTTNLRLQGVATSRIEMVEDARKILKPLLNEVRSMVPSEQGAYHIESATATSLTFFSDVDGDGIVERARYFLSGGELRRGIVEPTGSPLIYDLDDEVVKPLIQNVISLNFSYYTHQYTGQGTTGLLTGNFSVSDIRMVKVSVTIDDDVNRSPNPVGIVESAVTIRNLKDNL